MPGKSLIILCITWLLPCGAFSQMDANWVFGKNVGLNFHDGEITPYTTSIYSIESSASISDSDGNLLFYTDGITVWNKNHIIMENGDEIYSNYLDSFFITSCTQGTIILPIPDSDLKFYIFSLSAFSSEPGLMYSIVDQNLNEGLGAVVSKENLLLEPELSEKLIAVKHGNGRDWWIIGHQNNSDVFFKFLITPSAVEGPFYQHIGAIYLDPVLKFGEMEITNDGSKLAITEGDSVIIYSFDRCSGILSDYTAFSTPFISDTQKAYGCAFSVNANYLYISSEANYLYQLNINEDDSESGSWTLIYETESSNYDVEQIQLAGDGKIYVCMNKETESVYNKNLSVINNPDLEGILSNFDTATIYLGGNISFAGLPNMPNYRLGALAGSPCDTITAIHDLEIKNEFTLYPNPANSYIIITSQSGNYSNIKVEIYHASGILVKEVKNISSNQKINLEDLHSGIYHVAVKQNNEYLYHEKLIIIR